MAETLHREFLKYSSDKLRQSSGRIESCLAQLTEQQVWTRCSENENAVGNLVLHLCGNVRQWIVAGVGGAPDTRQREQEFATREALAVPELTGRLRATVEQAVAVIEGVSEERLAEPLIVQNYAMTVLTAIYHVVEHFSGHAGQIIFATKLLTGADMGFYRHLRTTAAHGEKTP